MKTLSMLVLCFVALGAVPAAAQEPLGPGEVVAELFRLMKAKDAGAMQGLMHPEARLITTAVRDGVPVASVVPVERWIQGVGSSTRELDERIHDTRVDVSDALASVWTRYDLFVDGALSHCGVDHVLLVLTPGGWKIIHLSDTRTTEGCAAT
ncbi:MAG: nuclear transport factor 2 family protein [Longimicrobiales bacterium]